MPRGDGTGPAGQGPLTGRGLGTCVSGIRRLFGGRNAQAGDPRQVWGSPLGRGSGQGQGFMRGGGQGAGRGAGRGRGRRR